MSSRATTVSMSSILIRSIIASNNRADHLSAYSKAKTPAKATKPIPTPTTSFLPAAPVCVAIAAVAVVDCTLKLYALLDVDTAATTEDEETA